MRDRIFVDTNVLVYAYDRSEAANQQRAVEVLDLLIASGKGVISTQVLSEFFNAVTRKIRMPLTIEAAMASVENHTRAWRVLDVTTFIILEAIRGVRDHQLPFWDAQIWATARLNQVPVGPQRRLGVEQNARRSALCEPVCGRLRTSRLGDLAASSRVSPAFLGPRPLRSFCPGVMRSGFAVVHGPA